MTPTPFLPKNYMRSDSLIRNTIFAICLWVIAGSAMSCGSGDPTDTTVPTPTPAIEEVEPVPKQETEKAEPAPKPATEIVEPAAKSDTESIKIEDVVSIEFPEDEYTFTMDEASKGVRFGFTIVVSQDIADIIPLYIEWPEWVGPSGLFPSGRISGNGQSYSIDDVGLGLWPDQTPRTFKKGDYPHFFDWDGRNWAGPSDTDTPKGAPFPPGTYSLQIRLVGKIKYEDELKLYEIIKSAKVNLKP